MDLISELKGIISPQVAENIGEFLGEDKEKVANAIDLAVPSFLGGLMKYGKSTQEAEKVMKVLHDGGHSGDILENVNGLLSNFDKTQLIITIGNNIVSHFFGTKANLVVEKISEISGVKKTSASSLFSISAPLILGLIGRKVKSRGLVSADLVEILNKQGEVVSASLPPAISNALDIKFDALHQKKNSAEKKTTQSDGKLKYVLPWLFLAILGAASIYYFYLGRKKETGAVKITVTDWTLAAKDTSVNPDELLGPRMPDSLQAAAQKTEERNTSAEKPAVKAEPLVVSVPGKQAEPKKDAEISPPKSFTDGWAAVTGVSFERNSAAVSDYAGVADLVKRLKTGQKIHIAVISNAKRSLAEDRSYAIRDLLIENGLEDSRIVMSRSAVDGPEGNGVAIRIR